MKNNNLTICDAVIYPGETANLALPLPEFYSCTSFCMPIKVFHGKEAGPCLLILSAIKGDELNGLEIINRLFESERLSGISGTLIAVPVLNIFGLIEPTRAPHHEASLDQCFPGKSSGSYGERLAHVFTQEILSKATNCIELQTGSLNHDILPQVYADLSHEESKRLARGFEAPVITNVRTNNSFRETTENLHIPLLVYQAGEAMRFSEPAINLGLSGIFKVMEALEMLPKDEKIEQEAFRPIFSQDQDWIRAHRSGMLRSNISLGQMIKKGQNIGRINDPFSADTGENVTAPQDGVVVGINRHPLIHEGQTIFKIASFIDNDRAGSVLEAWSDSHVEPQ